MAAKNKAEQAEQVENIEQAEPLNKNTEIKKCSKEQFLKSKTFQDQKDLVNALLEDGKEYTVEEVKKIIDDFLNAKTTENRNVDPKEENNEERKGE